MLQERQKNDIPQETSDDMLQQPDRLHLDKSANHVAQDCANSVETLVGGADVAQAGVIQEDLLHDEYGDGL